MKPGICEHSYAGKRTIFKSRLFHVPVLISYIFAFIKCDTIFRLKDKNWTSELILVEISGRINSFLVSLSGYQVGSKNTLYLIWQKE
jgi:hypothetical protein